MTKLLEKRVSQKGDPIPVKPEAERRRLEEMREREFLRAQGVAEEDLPKLTSQFVSRVLPFSLPGSFIEFTGA